MSEDNFVIVKNAVLLNRKEIQAREWRNYIINNWNTLTEHLNNATILIIAGRHGKQSGAIGPKDDSLFETHQKQVKAELNLKTKNNLQTLQKLLIVLGGNYE